MTGKSAVKAALVAVAMTLTLAVQAANLDGPPLPAGPAGTSQGAGARDGVADFGTGANIMQIPAAAFTLRVAGADPAYIFSGYIYNTCGFNDCSWAPVFLPTGAAIEYLDLYAYDTNAGSDITASLRMWTGYGTHPILPTVAPSFSDLTSTASSGSAGAQYVIGTFLSPRHTVNNDVVYGGGAQYSVVMNIPVRDGSLGFKAVDIWWYRQIAPAPGVASFTDVPTNAQFFREVEALAASGITSGCTATTFCPDQAVTRRQMAAFLSRALGLGYSY
ncbi:MAG: S-layer homology domain-containing protein [Alphaproteobacteria bacterium]